MMRWNLPLCVFAVLVCFTVAQDWSFETPDTWELDYPECGGLQQSPINLDDTGPDKRELKTAALKKAGTRYEVSYYNKTASGSYFFTGDSLEMQFNKTDLKDTPAFLITENGKTTEYYLESQTLYYEGQHSWKNIRGPAELQLLHRDSEGNMLILVYMVTKCTWGLQTDITEVMKKMLNLLDPETEVVLEPFPATDILASATIKKRRGKKKKKESNVDPVCDIYKYTGSLVEPPCTENVIYFVFSSPLCFSDEQLENIRDAKLKYGNVFNSNRPKQPLNGRVMDLIRC